MFAFPCDEAGGNYIIEALLNIHSPSKSIYKYTTSINSQN
jgi:hypothetical protein